MSQTETFIQATDRRTLRVQEAKFLGSASEAATYCAAMNGMNGNFVFTAITRPVENLAADLRKASNPTLAMIEDDFQRAARA